MQQLQSSGDEGDEVDAEMAKKLADAMKTQEEQTKSKSLACNVGKSGRLAFLAPTNTQPEDVQAVAGRRDEQKPMALGALRRGRSSTQVGPDPTSATHAPQ